MKAYRVEEQFGIDSIVEADVAPEALVPGSVRLKMKAATLNYRDLLMVTGRYNPKQPLPLVPLSDGVGEVVEIGEGVSRVQVGDRVCPLFARGWLAGEMEPEVRKRTHGGPLDGTLREEMVIDEASLVHVPAHLSDAMAASLPCAAVTAWSALVTSGQIRAGDDVLLLGTGGVSIMALQLAKALGARVIVTSSSDEKLARAKALGADALVNYRDDPQWGKTVRELTNGRGVDHVVEVGGVGTLAQSLRAVRLNGTVSLIGVLAGTQANTSLLPVLMGNVRIQGVFVGHRQSFEAMNRCIEVHRIEPVVSETFPVSEVRDALRWMERGEHFGKIALTW